MASYPELRPQRVGGRDLARPTSPRCRQSGAENNEAIEGQYTPGSTFKLVTATAALQDGLIAPDHAVRRHRHVQDQRLPGRRVSTTTPAASCTTTRATPAATYNVSGALTASSDAFFYNLGEMFWEQQSKFGTTPIQNEATAYGEGTITGIDLPGEAQGRVDSYLTRAKLHAEAPKGFPYAASWFTGDNIEMAFGQGETVLTPIEQAVAYSTFANGGTRYAPQVASEVVDPPDRQGDQEDRAAGDGEGGDLAGQLQRHAGRGSRASSRARAGRRTRTSRASRPRGTWPARRAPPRTSRASSRTAGSWPSVPTRIRSTSCSPSSTRAATAPRPPPPWCATSSTTSWPIPG